MVMMFLSSVSYSLAETRQGTERTWGQLNSDEMLLERLKADSLLLNHSIKSMDTRFQEAPKSRISELNEQLIPDFSLGISYNNRSLNRSFLENNSILSKKGFEDQFLFTIDISPAVIILDQFALEFTYSAIPHIFIKSNQNFIKYLLTLIQHFLGFKQLIINSIIRF